MIVFDRYSKERHRTAGYIENNTACVWDGTGIPFPDNYWFHLRLKNSYGRFLEKVGPVVVLCMPTLKALSLEEDEEILNVETQDEDITLDNNLMMSETLQISPNPVSDYLSVVFPQHKEIEYYAIHSAIGMQMLQATTASFSEQIDVRSFPQGIYLLRVFYKDGSAEQAKFVKK